MYGRTVGICKYLKCVFDMAFPAQKVNELVFLFSNVKMVNSFFIKQQLLDLDQP